jgi:hypothetical protein
MTDLACYHAIDSQDGASVRVKRDTMERATVDAAGRASLTNVVPHRTYATKDNRFSMRWRSSKKP